MIEIERTAGEAVQIGRYVVRVLAVHHGEVVVALLDPDEDDSTCGDDPWEAVSVSDAWRPGGAD